ncbi:TIGR03086 family metal-binding protein [Streptomyces sp. Ru87]|nr:TIGR03086 family metal-binding protein [Streptomyces sp. Ru87]PGH50042.1 TIGR03086 family protein [Streptomyces sp. Ru87]
MTDMPADPRPLAARAAAQLAVLLDDVRPEALARPTPCADWDVRALTEHIVSVAEAYAVIGETGRDEAPDGVRARPLPEAPADRAAVFATARERLAAAWRDDAKLDKAYVLPWGEVSGRGTLTGYLLDGVTHAWDLARALDSGRPLDPELAEVSLAAARRVLPPERRGGPTPFEPVRPAPQDADAYGRLAAWLGRDADWRAGRG